MTDLFPKKENIFGTSFIDNKNAEALFSFKDNSINITYKINNRNETATGDLERIEATDFSHKDSFRLNAEWKSRDAIGGRVSNFTLSNFSQVKINTILIQINGSGSRHIATIELTDDNFEKLKELINKFPKSYNQQRLDEENRPKSDNASEHRERIRALYSAFDDAFSKIAMDNYLNEFYSNSARSKLYERELNSYDKYEYKTHIIEKIILNSDRSDSYKSTYYVEFYFDFKRKDGVSGKRLCADYISLDDQNKVVERVELGQIK